ncbi:MAG: hypothetical protein ACI358_06630 [Candidatus Limimorpha sp.]
MAEKTFKEELDEMAVGDIKEYPIDNLISIRSQCSQYGLTWNKKFNCKSNREKRILTVTRTK